jgi:hypothetical protein
VFLTAYAPIELTRCIVKYNYFDDVTRLELSLIWGLYLGFIAATERIANLITRTR